MGRALQVTCLSLTTKRSDRSGSQRLSHKLSRISWTVSRLITNHQWTTIRMRSFHSSPQCPAVHHTLTWCFPTNPTTLPYVGRSVRYHSIGDAGGTSQGQPPHAGLFVVRLLMSTQHNHKIHNINFTVNSFLIRSPCVLRGPLMISTDERTTTPDFRWS